MRVTVRFQEESGARHFVSMHSEDDAVLLLSAMGMQPNEQHGYWYLPYGQKNPGRIETARVTPE